MSSKSTPPRKKFIPSAYTVRVVDRFFEIDRWSLFAKQRRVMEGLFQVGLAGQFAERITRISKFVDLARKPFTMRAFYKICRAHHIRVFRYKRAEKDVYGQYYPGHYKDRRGRWRAGDAIWLKPDLRGNFLLEVAAHEISHFCLHRELALTTGRLMPFCKELNNVKGKESKRMSAELEADLMTAMLLTGGRQKNEN